MGIMVTNETKQYLITSYENIFIYKNRQINYVAKVMQQHENYISKQVGVKV